MTNPEYILEFMRDNDTRFYTISNTFDRETVRKFEDRSLDDAIREMKRFLKNNTGFHRIYLFQTNEILRGGKPKGNPAIFEVSVQGNEFREDKPEETKTPAGLAGQLTAPSPSPSGAIVGVDQYLNIHQVNSELRTENEKLKMQLEYMKQNHERELEQLRRDMDGKIKEAQDSNQMFSQGLGLIMQRMGVGE
jgi:hypothetical protein